MTVHVDKATATIALATGTITYSWVADATEMTTFLASLIGIVTASLGAWFYYERAMDMRRKRRNKDGEKGSRKRDSVSE